MKGIGDVGAGHTLGRYELLVPIARGGMAVVWAARMMGSRGFQKLVAIKSMLPSLTDDDGTFEEMFMAEAQLAAQIRHPNCCEILDLGEQDGVLFIVMEWVDGEPLGTIHKVAREANQAIPIAITTRIGVAVAQGLHAAHEMKNQETGEPYGLVHRDVSPQNILITHDGVVKVVDFGVAKATASLGMNKTAVGQLKGKVTYMAPEQARGESVDRRADIFALGIVLYQLVTNRHPFKGETPLKTMGKIMDHTPVVPPITYTPTCHPALSAAIVKALDKDPKKRFATMGEFALALEGVLSKMVTRGNDLAPWVKQMVGDRSDKRRELIREALRTADERKEKPKAKAPRSDAGAALKTALAAEVASMGDDTGRTPSASSMTPEGARPKPPRPPGAAEVRAPQDTLDEVDSQRDVAVVKPSGAPPSKPAAAKSEPPRKSGAPGEKAAAKSEPPKVAKKSEPPKAANKKSEPPKAASKKSEPPKAAKASVPPPSDAPRSRAWLWGALVVVVAAIAIVAFTVPGALDRVTPRHAASALPSASAAPSVAPSATAAPTTSASAEPSAEAAASAEPPGSASADPAASAAPEASPTPSAAASATVDAGAHRAAPRGVAPRPPRAPAPAANPAGDAPDL